MYYLEHPELSPASMVNVDICRILYADSWKKRCSCGVGLICYDTDSKTYPCHLFSPITLNKEQLMLLHSSNIDFSDTELFADAKCEKCAIHKCCSRCYGMNFIYTGSVASTPSIFCSASQIEFFATCSLLYQRLRRHQQIANKHEIETVLTHIQKVIQTK